MSGQKNDVYIDSFVISSLPPAARNRYVLYLGSFKIPELHIPDKGIDSLMLSAGTKSLGFKPIPKGESLCRAPPITQCLGFAQKVYLITLNLIIFNDRS